MKEKKEGDPLGDLSQPCLSGDQRGSGYLEHNHDQLLARVVTHINRLLESKQPIKDSNRDTVVANGIQEPLLAASLRRQLSQPHARAVMELHFCRWFKQVPVRQWLWECYKIQENTECLSDPQYLEELEQILVQATNVTLETRNDPIAMRSLLHELLAAPWQFE